MIEKEWYLVCIWLSGNNVPLRISMTKKELEKLKFLKIEGIKFYFETTEELSDRLFLDVTEVVAISESKKHGYD